MLEKRPSAADEEDSAEGSGHGGTGAAHTANSNSVSVSENNSVINTPSASNSPATADKTGAEKNEDSNDAKDPSSPVESECSAVSHQSQKCPITGLRAKAGPSESNVDVTSMCPGAAMAMATGAMASGS